jgi:hypothetical protein
MGEGKIVYQHRTGIWVYDLASGRSDQVPIQLPSDRLQERECFVDPKATLGSWALSKDGERIAWADEKHRLRVTDALTGADASVDLSEGEITKYVWSPDSRTLAYVVTLKNLFGQVRVWDAETRKSVPGTDPMFHSFSPAWDPKEKFLYFLSGRYINPYLDRNEPRFIVNDATLPFVLALQADGALPFVPRGDVDPPKPDEKDAKDGKNDDAKDAKKGTAKEEESPPRSGSTSTALPSGWSRSRSRRGTTTSCAPSRESSTGCGSPTPEDARRRLGRHLEAVRPAGGPDLLARRPGRPAGRDLRRAERGARLPVGRPNSAGGTRAGSSG